MPDSATTMLAAITRAFDDAMGAEGMPVDQRQRVINRAAWGDPGGMNPGTELRDVFERVRLTWTGCRDLARLITAMPARRPTAEQLAHAEADARRDMRDEDLASR
jgi:hypothetical protein